MNSLYLQWFVKDSFLHILHEFHEIKLNVMSYALNCVSWNSLKEIFHSVSSHFCILICNCICLFLSSLVVYPFFDNLQLSFCLVGCSVSMLVLFFSFFCSLQSHWFLVKINVRHWVERYFFSLTVFGRYLLAYDVHSSVKMDGYVQLTSAYSLDA